MLGKTHLFYGVTAGAIVVFALAHSARPLPLVEGALTGAFGGLLPDLDEPGAMISNAPRLLGGMARRRLRRATRRTLFSLPGLLVGALIGLAEAILNVVSRALSHLVRFVAGGHREGSHWLPVWAGLSVAAYLLTAPYAGPWPAAGFSAGYLSHLAGDGCTRAGIPLIPGAAARLHLLPRPLRIRTGSASETFFTVLYAIALGAAIGAMYYYKVAAL